MTRSDPPRLSYFAVLVVLSCESNLSNTIIPCSVVPSQTDSTKVLLVCQTKQSVSDIVSVPQQMGRIYSNENQFGLKDISNLNSSATK